MESVSHQGFWPPGPGIRLLCFSVIYLAVIALPRGEWWRFFALLILALTLIPPGIPALRKSMKMLARSVPILFFLAVVVLLFGGSGDSAAHMIMVNVMVRTIVAVVAASVIWGGAGTLDFIRALHQLRIPGLVFSMITLAIHFMGRMGKNARTTMDAVQARSGYKIPFFRRIKLIAPLTRHFLVQIVESHSQIHMAMVSRGYAGGALVLQHPPLRRKEWAFFAVFCIVVIGVATIW